MHRLAAFLLVVSLALVPRAFAQSARPGAPVRLALATYVTLGYDNGTGFVPALLDKTYGKKDEEPAAEAVALEER